MVFFGSVKADRVARVVRQSCQCPGTATSTVLQCIVMTDAHGAGLMLRSASISQRGGAPHAPPSARNPVCAVCAARGRVVAAVVADHVVPLKDGGARFDWANLAGCCVSCHNRKSARETAAKRTGLNVRQLANGLRGNVTQS